MKMMLKIGDVVILKSTAIAPKTGRLMTVTGIDDTNRFAALSWHDHHGNLLKANLPVEALQVWAEEAEPLQEIRADV